MCVCVFVCVCSGGSRKPIQGDPIYVAEGHQRPVMESSRRFLIYTAKCRMGTCPGAPLRFATGVCVRMYVCVRTCVCMYVCVHVCVTHSTHFYQWLYQR